MILLEVQCPRCKKVQKWLSYRIIKREQLFQRQATCKVCGKEFYIKGVEVNRIVREIRFK